MILDVKVLQSVAENQETLFRHEPSSRKERQRDGRTGSDNGQKERKKEKVLGRVPPEVGRLLWSPDILK